MQDLTRQCAEGWGLVDSLPRMRFAQRIAARVVYERRKRTIRRFHRLYYGSSWQTWKNTRWLNINAYKTPLDLWIYQELIVALRPQLVVETGTAAGGSALFLATVCDAIGVGEVLSIDCNVRAGRPTHDRVTYVTGSSTAPETLDIVAEHAKGKAPVMVVLDSDHSRDHVLAELREYAEFVTPGSYLVVDDTNLNGHPVVPDFGPGPMEAVDEFLGERRDFKHEAAQEKFFLSFNPNGYLRRTSPRAMPGSSPAAPRRKARSRAAAERRSVRPTPRTRRRVAAATALLIFLLVLLPEMLGDDPYDPRPSTWPQVAHRI
jgi:cephalosporin hydroxylase